jgi:tetratricopeptide (TPR) repeat protein
MTSNLRRLIFFSQFSALSLSSLLIGNLTAAVAQVPGIPMPGATTPASTATTPGSGTVLSGQVKTDIAPAEKLLSQGKYSDAEGIFRELLVNNPADIQATAGLGMALAKQFKLDGADDLFDRVLKQDPNNAQSYAGKATVLLNRLQSSSGSIRSQRDSILKQAEQYASQATRLAPASGEAHFALGQVYKEQERADEAASEFRNAISFDPNMSYAYSSLGSIKLDQNSLAEASENFKRAIDLNSGNSTAHYGLGAALLKQNRPDDAIQELNTSLYQFPNSWPTRMALGQAYQAQGNSAAALKEYQLSTLIKPENADPYLRMADIREERGDLELALADLHSGLTQAPYNLDLRQRIADVTLRLEKPDDAIKAYRTILQMSPNNPAAVKGLSQALYLKAQKAAVGALLASNDYEAALSTLDEAIKLNQNDMELLLAKAKLMSLAGAKPDLSTMGQPTNDGQKVAYAQALMAAGDFQKETELLQSVVGDQTDAKQSYALADIALMIRDLDNAEAAYKKGLSQSGSPDRGQRGLTQITQLRKTAQDDVPVADELYKKKQFEGAVAKYREALASNPRLPDARFGLARALETTPKANSAMLDEAVMQYQYYLTMKQDLPQKDKEKLVTQCAKLTDKSAKLKQKETKSKR